ncbi:hypothetical protein BH09PAT4_BH09PAT4_05470 [soil metagenome]
MLRQLQRKYGKNNVISQKYYKTAHGGRRADFLVRSGKKFFLVEVKSGNSRYTKSQKQKDEWIRKHLLINTHLYRKPRR